MRLTVHTTNWTRFLLRIICWWEVWEDWIIVLDLFRLVRRVVRGIFAFCRNGGLRLPIRVFILMMNCLIRSRCLRIMRREGCQHRKCLLVSLIWWLWVWTEILHVRVFGHLLLVAFPYFPLFYCSFRCRAILHLFDSQWVVIFCYRCPWYLNRWFSSFLCIHLWVFSIEFRRRCSDVLLMNNGSCSLPRERSLSRADPSQNIESLLFHSIHRTVIEWVLERRYFCFLWRLFGRCWKWVRTIFLLLREKANWGMVHQVQEFTHSTNVS